MNTYFNILRNIVCRLWVVALLGCAGAKLSSAQVLSGIPAAFAEVGIGARAAALGYAGTAAVTGSGAISWNPASILPEDGFEISASYVDQIEAVEFGHLAMAFPVMRRHGAFALSVQVTGDDMLMESTVRAAYAHRIRFLWLGVGGSLRRATYGNNALSDGDFVVFELDEIAQGRDRQVHGSALGFSVDAGLRMYWADFLIVAVSARNIAAPVSWESEATARSGVRSYVESVPLEISSGVSYRLSNRIRGFLEWTPAMTSDAISRVGLGASYRPVEVISFRLGRLVLQDGLQNEWNTFGFGIRTPSRMKWSLEADYAYIMSDLAHTQQISLRLGL